MFLAKDKQCCQNNKKGGEKKLSNELRIFVKKNENFIFKKVPYRCGWVIFNHSHN
jgi:hypothetical protein